MSVPRNPPKPPRRRTLTPEEHELWLRVARSADPLRKSDPPKAAGREIDGAPPIKPSPKSLAVRPSRVQTSPRILRPVGSAIAPCSASFAARGPAELSARTPGLDARTATRLMRGRMAPQARLDLHGMTVEHAHSALIHFIMESSELGRRCVLVITGKGGAREVGRESFDGFTLRRDGVLRRDAPRWLAMSPLSGMVVGIYQAHQKHGGAGAMYVYLKKIRY